MAQSQNKRQRTRQGDANTHLSAGFVRPDKVHFAKVTKVQWRLNDVDSRGYRALARHTLLAHRRQESAHSRSSRLRDHSMFRECPRPSQKTLQKRRESLAREIRQSNFSPEHRHRK